MILLLVPRFFLIFLFATSNMPAFNSQQLYAQSLNHMVKQSMNKSRITISHGDSVETFTITNQKLKKSLDNAFYLWYTSGQLKHAQGSYDGKLLDGLYTLSYYDKSLIEHGQVRMGLKMGEWKSWYKNGFLYKNQSWSKGLPQGKYISYHSNGEIWESGSYRDGKRQGKWYIYPIELYSPVTDSFQEYPKIKPIIERYRKGQLVNSKRPNAFGSRKRQTADSSSSVISSSDAADKVQKKEAKKGLFTKSKEKTNKEIKKNQQTKIKRKEDTQLIDRKKTKNKVDNSPSKESQPKEKKKNKKNKL